MSRKKDNTPKPKPVSKKAKQAKEIAAAEKAKRDVAWNKDPALTDKLISSILENAEIKQGLYSSVGGNASSSRGGGKSKSEHHWSLAQMVFGENPKYAEFIELGNTDTKERQVWATKIKNRLQSLETAYAVHKETMGQTGAGIDREDEIDMSQDNEFVNKWEKIKQEFPWFWDMKTLVQDRPNRIRTGLGNGETEIDFSAIMPGARPEREESSEAPSGAADTMHNGHDSDMSLDIGQEVVDSDDDQPSSVHKRSVEEVQDDSDTEKASKRDIKPVVKAGPARSATPAKPAAKRPKIVESLSEVAVAEEATKLKSLELRLKRVEFQREKIAAKHAIKQEQTRLKANLMRVKLEKEHELEIERMRGRYRLALAQTHAQLERGFAGGAGAPAGIASTAGPSVHPAPAAGPSGTHPMPIPSSSMLATGITGTTGDGGGMGNFGDIRSGEHSVTPQLSGFDLTGADVFGLGGLGHDLNTTGGGEFPGMNGAEM